jgi:glycosyltransferase involved in cell wall biosynthesis
VNSAWPQSWGGGEKWTVDAAAWLQDCGHKILVAAREQSRLAEAARTRNLAVVETKFGGDYDPLAMLRAQRIMKDFSADLAVVNFNKEAWHFGMAGRLLGIPVVARHGLTVLGKNWRHRFLAERVITKLIVNAESIRNEYGKRGLSVSRIEVIHNGVKFVPQKSGELRKRLGLSTQTKIVLGAGRLESQKRFDRFLDAAKIIVQHIPDAHFVIAGEGPDEEKLREQAERLDLSSRVHFTGFIRDLAEIISDADLFMLTSAEEGTPNVLLEAMAARVACLSVEVGSTPEIFSGNLSENLFSQYEIDRLAMRAVLLLTNEINRESVADSMQARVQEDFSFDSSMQKFERIFHRVAQTV